MPAQLAQRLLQGANRGVVEAEGQGGVVLGVAVLPDQGQVGLLEAVVQSQRTDSNCGLITDQSIQDGLLIMTIFQIDRDAQNRITAITLQHRGQPAGRLTRE